MFHRITPLASRLLPVLAACALPAAGLFAGTTLVSSKDKNPVQAIMDDITPLNVFQTEASYVGNTSFHTDSVHNEHQEEFEFQAEYGHRFHLFDKVYLKLGANYERFDFSTTAAPLPSGLQSITGVVALEYIVQGQPGLFITSQPGVYFSDTGSIGTGNFDIPTTAGGIVPLGKKIYLLLGIHTSILAEYPVLPIAGLVWLINDHLRLEAVPPNPRLIYSVSEKLDFFVGGEILGNTYKRDETTYANRNFRRFSGGVIDYSEFRLGGGLTFSPSKIVDIDINGGYMLERSFNYYRGDDKDFRSNGAPYARVAVSAEF